MNGVITIPYAKHLYFISKHLTLLPVASRCTGNSAAIPVL